LVDDDEKIRQLQTKYVQGVKDGPPAYVPLHHPASDVNQLIDHREGFCTIFVGNAKVPFTMPLLAVGQRSNFLSDRVQFNDQLKSYIDLSDASDNWEITPKEFHPIVEYLQRGDFGKRLIGTPGTLPRIDGIVMQEQSDFYAEHCAQVFRVASFLQLTDLQRLALNKLRALYPLSLLRMLIVTKICQQAEAHDEDVVTEVGEWLVDHISEYYFCLVKEEGAILVQVLSESPSLERAVMERVAQSPASCRKGLEFQ